MFYCYFLLLLFLFYFYFIFFFHDKRLPIDNVYFNNYDAPVNREPFEAAPLLIYPCFTVEKLVNSFLARAWIWKNDQNISCSVNSVYSYMTQGIGSLYLKRLSLSVFMCDTDVIISPSICGQVQLSSTEPLKLGFLNSERNNLVKFETS